MIAQAFTNLPPVPEPVQQPPAAMLTYTALAIVCAMIGFIAGSLFRRMIRRHEIAESYHRGFLAGTGARDAAMQCSTPTVKLEPRPGCVPGKD